MSGRAAEMREMRVDLPGVGESDQADVGDELEFEDDLLLLSGPAGLRFARRLVGRSGVGGVAAAALSAPGRHAFLAVRGEIEEEAVLVLDDGPDGDAEAEVETPLAITIAAFAGSAVLGFEEGLEAVVGEGADVLVSDERNVPPVAAVPSVRAALRDTGLATEADTAVAPLPGLQRDGDLVDEQRRIRLFLKRAGRRRLFPSGPCRRT